MNNDYEKLRDFWDKVLKSDDLYKPEGKFIEDDRINNIFKKYINEDTEVLDFGCGSGWALPEIYYTSKFKYGLGIDQSENGIDCARKTAIAALPEAHIEYITEDVNLVDRKFDFIFTCNTLDVVPDEITLEMIDSLYNKVNDGGYVLVCLNPAFTIDQLVNLIKMEKREDHYYYINGILRCNYKTVEEWVELFKTRFTVVEFDEFFLTKQDKFLRRYYLLKK